MGRGDTLAKYTARVCLGFSLIVPAGEGMAEQSKNWAAQREAEHASTRAVDTGALVARTRALVAGHEAQEAAQRDAQEEAWLGQSGALEGAAWAGIAAQMKQAAEMLSAENYDGAQQIYTAVLDLDPLQHEARFGLGRCLRLKGQLADAAYHFSQIIEMPLANPEHRMTKTWAMLSMQDLPPPSDPRVADPAVIFRAEDTPSQIWDAPYAPVMTVVPAGEYTMGSPESEQFRLPSEQQHRVRIAYPLAFSKYNVTRGEFAAFVADTGYEAKGCNREGQGGMGFDPDGDWRTPGFEQTDDHPVVCINHHDASAYAQWLSEQTGATYRLPSEAEWEHAIRGGTSSAYYWGNTAENGHANCDGCEGQRGARMTTPGGAFPPNPFGLYDMAGNVWVWLADCWNASYEGAPTDGSAWMAGNCSLRARRSGSWFNVEEKIEGDPRQPGRLRSASRFGSIPSLRYSSFGFRVVREL